MAPQDSPAQIVRRFRVTGRVQGVYFRHGTRIEADRLALRGFARNLPDGSVEVLAAGAPEALDALRAWLERGPPRARVDAVTELAPGGEGAPPAGFEIR